MYLQVTQMQSPQTEQSLRQPTCSLQRQEQVQQRSLKPGPGKQTIQLSPSLVS